MSAAKIAGPPSPSVASGWCGAAPRPHAATRAAQRPWRRPGGPAAGPIRAPGGRSNTTVAATPRRSCPNAEDQRSPLLSDLCDVLEPHRAAGDLDHAPRRTGAGLDDPEPGRTRTPTRPARPLAGFGWKAESGQQGRHHHREVIGPRTPQRGTATPGISWPRSDQGNRTATDTGAAAARRTSTYSARESSTPPDGSTATV
jgi:hypothetical protein